MKNRHTRLPNHCRILPDLLYHHAVQHPTKNLLYSKKDGEFFGISAVHIQQHAARVAETFSSFLLESGSRICILSANRPEWVIADLGILTSGSISVPIYTTLSDSETRYIINDSQARYIFIDSIIQLQKITRIFDQCPHLTGVIMFDDCPAQSPKWCMHWEDFIYHTPKPDISLARFNERLSDINPNQVASIVYTSGTTGNPKGVMLTHHNFMSNIADILSAVPLNESEIVLSFLPLSHVFERTAGYYTLLAIGGRIYYAESIDTVRDDIGIVRPTVVVSVPRLYEKIHSRVLEQVTGFKTVLFNWAFRVGERYNTRQKNHQFISTSLRIFHKIASALVFNKIKARTGGRLRFFVSGGAPLNPEIGRFFDTIGILILEGYGMTESSPVIACNRIDNYQFGSVGKALNHVETRLTSDGELLVRGPNVMAGYWNIPNDQNSIIDSDGWLHTGDIATVDDNGFIRIIDRKKELIILSTGKNVSPLAIEESIKTSPYVSQIVVVGDNKKYVIALIVPNFDTLKTHPSLSKSSQLSNTAIIKNPLTTDLFNRILNEKSHSFSAYEIPKKIILLPDEFTQETGELTPTLKPKRRIIQDRYRHLIDSMYHSN